MPKLTLKRLPTLQQQGDEKPLRKFSFTKLYKTHAFRISAPSVNFRKSSKSLISISKAAEMLQVNPDTLRNWEKQGRLIPDRTPGGSRRYNLFELEEMQKQLNLNKKPAVKIPTAGLSVSKAAKMLQVSPDTIRNWDNRGLIPSQRSDGGARRFSKKVILKLQDEMNIPVPSQPKKLPELSDFIPQGNDSGSGWFHHSLVLGILSLLGCSGLLLGLYTGFQIMNKLDKISSNTVTMQQQLAAVSGIADTARQLSQNIKLESFKPSLQSLNPDSKVLGEFTNGVDQIVLQGSTKVEGLLTAPNIIYGLIGGKNVSVSGGQTPTISLELPAVVNSLGGENGDLTLAGGNDISVNGLVITDTSTLSSVRGRGGCAGCLTDSDIQDRISISSEGNIDVAAVKSGELSAEHGGTGLGSFIAGDILFADTNTSFTALNLGSEGEILTVGASGKPVWSNSFNMLADTVQELSEKVKNYNLALDGEGNIILPQAKADRLILSADFPVDNSAPNYFDVAAAIQGTDLKIKDAESNIATHSSQIASANTALDSLKAEIALLSDKIASSSATPVPELTPPSVLLATQSAQLADLSVTSEATVSGQLTAFKATVSDTFKSLGGTFLGNTTVAGDLIIDGTLSLADGNTINAMPTLFIQKSDLASMVDFFNGLVTIDKLGSLQAQSATVSELKVKGNKISGSGKMVMGTKSVEITSPVVTSKSRILLTSTLETDAVLAVTAKEDNKKFVVTASKNVPVDLTFDWFLINEVE